MDTAMSPMRPAARRLGGALVILGAVAWPLLSGLHGEVPGTGHRDVADALHPLWRPLHLLTIAAIAVVAAGLSLLAGTLGPPRAAVLGRAGGAFVVPAGAVLGVGYAIDGYVLAQIAEAAARAQGEAERAAALMPAGIALAVIGATSFAFQTLFGIGVTLIASATLRSGEYPRPACWLGAIGGAASVLAGVLLFCGAAGDATWLLIAATLAVAVWLLAVVWRAWRLGSPG